MITGPSAVGVAATIPSSTLSSEFILEANAEDGDVPSKRMHRCFNKTCRNFKIFKLDVGRFYWISTGRSAQRDFELRRQCLDQWWAEPTVREDHS